MRRNALKCLNYFSRRWDSKCPEECFIKPEHEKYLKCRKDVKLELCIIDDNMVDPCWELPEVVVIGAGVAGLSAAQRLITSGIRNVKIIEATHRAGGRVHSSWFGDVPVEIGASFIEGGSLSNPIYTLASQESLLSRPPLKYDSINALYLTSEGCIIPPTIAQAAVKSFHSLIDKAADLFITVSDDEDCGRLLPFLLKSMDPELKLFPSRYRDFASRVMLSEAIALKNKVGSCLNEVSARYFGNYIPLSGGRIRLQSGMIGIVAPLLRSLPSCESIRYCEPVTSIVWNPVEEYEDEKKTKRKPRVKVICSKGDVLTADYVIVTVPLGVLKNKMDTMFQPALPEKKKDAIKRLGYGHINHVYFEYNHPFWVYGEGCIRPCWSLDELQYNGHWTKGITSIDEVPTSQQILSVTLSHNAALTVEKLSNFTLAEEFTRLLRNFVKDPTLPYPANVLRTEWSSCPFSLGAKSFIKYEATVEDICELGRSVPGECDTGVPVLFFAGEATAVGSYGSLQGARISGIREAEKIINLTKTFQGKPSNKTSPEEAPISETPAAIAA